MASPIPWIRPQFFDNNAAFLNGGKVYTYVAGSSTPAATYTDISGSVENSNPIILDTRGECQIFLDDAVVYKIVLTDADDNEIYSEDNVSGTAASVSSTYTLKTDSLDPVAGYLFDKLAEGDNVSLTLNTSVLGNTITIASDNDKVAVDAVEASGFLEDVLVAGTNVTISKSGATLVVNSTLTDANDKVGISSADTTPDYLENKISAGTDITITKTNPAGDEGLEIAFTGTIPDDEKVAASATDTTPGFLNDKLVVGTGLTKSINNSGGDEEVQIDIDGEEMGLWEKIDDASTLQYYRMNDNTGYGLQSGPDETGVLFPATSLTSEAGRDAAVYEWHTTQTGSQVYVAGLNSNGLSKALTGNAGWLTTSTGVINFDSTALSVAVACYWTSVKFDDASVTLNAPLYVRTLVLDKDLTIAGTGFLKYEKLEDNGYSITSAIASQGYWDNTINGQELKDPNGFDTAETEAQDLLTMTINETTGLFEISPAGSSYNYYYRGEKVEVTTTKSVTCTPAARTNYWIYFSDNTATLTAVTSISGWEEIIRDNVFVAEIIWDDAGTAIIHHGFEPHGANMSWATHYYNHSTTGTRWASGLLVTPTEDTQNVSISSGQIQDEDIIYDTPTINTASNIRILYRLNTGWAVDDEVAGVSIDGSGDPQYNTESGGNWSLATSTGYVLVHYFARPDFENPVFAVVGQANYATRNAARDAAASEILALATDGLPFPEFKAIATAIVKDGSGTWDFETIDASGSMIIDWRTSAVGSPIASSQQSHSVLDNLGADDHTQYLLVDGTRAMSGNLDLGTNSISNVTTLNAGTGIFTSCTISGNSALTTANLATNNTWTATQDFDAGLKFSVAGSFESTLSATSVDIVPNGPVNIAPANSSDAITLKANAGASISDGAGTHFFKADQANGVTMSEPTTSDTIASGKYVGFNATGDLVVGNGGGGAVDSVSNADGTLTISPTTGSVVASLNLANANTWTAQQNFNSGATASSLGMSGSIDMNNLDIVDVKDIVGYTSDRLGLQSGSNTRYISMGGGSSATDYTQGAVIELSGVSRSGATGRMQILLGASDTSYLKVLDRNLATIIYGDKDIFEIHKNLDMQTNDITDADDVGCVSVTATTNVLAGSVAEIEAWSGNATYARFGHTSTNGVTNYGFLQNSGGTSYVQGLSVVVSANGAGKGFTLDGTDMTMDVPIDANSQNITNVGNLEVDGNTTLGDASGDSATFNAGTISMANLPTSDPTIAGQLWNDSGTLKVSAG